MFRRLFTILSLVSLTLCVGAVALWLRGDRGFCAAGVTVLARSDAIIFHNGKYDYTGSIIGMSSSKTPPPLDHTIAIEFFGFYLRYFRDPPLNGWWTLWISDWW